MAFHSEHMSWMAEGPGIQVSKTTAKVFRPYVVFDDPGTSDPYGFEPAEVRPARFSDLAKFIGWMALLGIASVTAGIALMALVIAATTGWGSYVDPISWLLLALLIAIGIAGAVLELRSP